MIRRGAGHDANAELIAHVLADQRDQFLERVVLRADAGAFERAIGEVGLQRLDEAALGLRREIALDRLRSGDRRLLRLEVEHRRKRRPRPVRGRKLREPGRAVGVNERDGAVGRAEIDSDPGGLSQAVTLHSCPRVYTTEAQRHRDPERTHRLQTRRAPAKRRQRASMSRGNAKDPMHSGLAFSRLIALAASAGSADRRDAFQLCVSVPLWFTRTLRARCAI